MSDEAEEEPVLSDVEDDEDDVEEKKVKPRSLTLETISEGLSLLCRTGNGLAHAFVRLDVTNKALNDISTLSSYIHLRFLNMSTNFISDLTPLSSLIHLLWLKVDKNAVTQLESKPFTQLNYLQWLSVAENGLTDVGGLMGPALESLNLTGNSIQSMHNFQLCNFPNLMILDMRKNKLETTDGINLPNLQRLYLAGNIIKRLEGLEKMENLTTLHLRDNQLESLEGLHPNMKCLQYLNVRGNAILDESSLQNLTHVSKTLRAVVLSDNPLVETTDHRINSLLFVPQLDRIDKDPVSHEERAEAQERYRELQELQEEDF